MEPYDVIIAGGSFAGLAVASQIRANVLLIDKCDIGTFQISACACPYELLEELDCKEAVLQICDTFTFHVDKRTIDFHFKRPYCTFDYEKFSKSLYSKTQAKFLKATLIKVEKDNIFKVYTSQGIFYSKILVDATGWSAVIAEYLKPGYVHKDMVSFGIETEVPYRTKNFHFFYEPKFIKDGVSWIFPCGEFSRFGVASYTGARKLIDKLDSFLNRFNLKAARIHGGFFCYCLKEPIVEGVFVVGCAQGQTLPLTGEGIRRCIYYGRKAGAIIARILEGEIDLKAGWEEYRQLALRVKPDFDFLLRAQNRLLKMSERNICLLARILSQRTIFSFLERRYRKI